MLVYNFKNRSMNTLLNQSKSLILRSVPIKNIYSQPKSSKTASLIDTPTVFYIYKNIKMIVSYL